MKKLILVILTTTLFSVNAMANVKHFVAFKYKSSVNAAQKEEVLRKFLNLKNEAKKDGRRYIVSIEAGVANSKEGFDQGMSQGFIVTFQNESDRDYYVGKPFTLDFDPTHEEFKQFVGPLLSVGRDGLVDGVYVFDFNTK